jgi:hypothetical protein
MAPSLRDAANQIEDENRHRVRLAKLEEIGKAWDDLFLYWRVRKFFENSRNQRLYLF